MVSIIVEYCRVLATRTNDESSFLLAARQLEPLLPVGEEASLLLVGRSCCDCTGCCWERCVDSGPGASYLMP